MKKGPEVFDLEQILNTLEQHGFNEAQAIAGFFGGVVHALYHRTGWVQGGISVLTGALMANFLTDDLVRYVGGSQGSIGFLIGMTSKLIFEGAWNFVKTKSARAIDARDLRGERP